MVMYPNIPWAADRLPSVEDVAPLLPEKEREFALGAHRDSVGPARVESVMEPTTVVEGRTTYELHAVYVVSRWRNVYSGDERTTEHTLIQIVAAGGHSGGEGQGWYDVMLIAGRATEPEIRGQASALVTGRLPRLVASGEL